MLAASTATLATKAPATDVATVLPKHVIEIPEITTKTEQVLA